MVKSVLLQFEEHDRRIFWISVIFFVCSLALYIYFLGISIFAVIERKGAEQRSRALSTVIMTDESRYVALNKQIDLALAHSRGFIDVTLPTYVASGDGTVAISMRAPK